MNIVVKCSLLLVLSIFIIHLNASSLKAQAFGQLLLDDSGINGAIKPKCLFHVPSGNDPTDRLALSFCGDPTYAGQSWTVSPEMISSSADALGCLAINYTNAVENRLGYFANCSSLDTGWTSISWSGVGGISSDSASKCFVVSGSESAPTLSEQQCSVDERSGLYAPVNLQLLDIVDKLEPSRYGRVPLITFATNLSRQRQGNACVQIVLYDERVNGTSQRAFLDRSCAAVHKITYHMQATTLQENNDDAVFLLLLSEETNGQAKALPIAVVPTPQVVNALSVTSVAAQAWSGQLENTVSAVVAFTALARSTD